MEDLPPAAIRSRRGDRAGRLKIFAACLAFALSGCASYRADPLDKTSPLLARAADLEGAAAKPVTVSALDRLVLANNPDLRAARARLGSARAQVLQAGILPNPQVSVSYPFLISGPGTTNAYTAAIGQDIKSILLLRTRGETARNAAAEIDATIFWQEWQTIGKARLLFVDILSGERSRKLLAQSQRFLKERFQLTSKAISDGNATLATLSPDLVAVGDVQRASDDLDRLQLGRRQQLNALLGLTPRARLVLSATPNVPKIDAGRIRGSLPSLPDRRPDLIALQYGYRSEDAKVRLAILSQFPNLSIGLSGGSDNTNVIGVGPQLTMDLPVFDRNQGGIALEQATREQLKREFRARLATADGEIESILAAQTLLARQLAALEPRLNEARSIAERTETAFKQGFFDERAYVDIEVARLSREQEKVGLQQSLLEGQVGLATLIGAGLPDISIEPEAPPADPLGLLRQARQ